MVTCCCMRPSLCSCYPAAANPQRASKAKMSHFIGRCKPHSHRSAPDLTVFPFGLLLNKFDGGNLLNRQTEPFLL